MTDPQIPQQPRVLQQIAVPVLKQTEPQFECTICWCVLPQSNIDKHLVWHQNTDMVSNAG